MSNIAIIAAAGSGERLPGAVAKQFRPIAGKPLLVWTVEKFATARMVDSVYLVVPENDLAYVKESIVQRHNLEIVDNVIAGSDSRFDSILCGLRALPDTTNLVLIHDAVRPLVTAEDIDRVAAEAESHDAAILAIPQSETLKRVEDEFVISTIDRRRMYVAQTPQVFKYEAIISAYIQALEQEREFTDDASVCEAYGISVRIVEGSHANIKITTVEDLEIARKLLEK